MPMVPDSSPSDRAMTKATITRASTSEARFSSRESLIASLSSKAMTRARSSAVEAMPRPQMR